MKYFYLSSVLFTHEYQICFGTFIFSIMHIAQKGHVKNRLQGEFEIILESVHWNMDM